MTSNSSIIKSVFYNIELEPFQKAALSNLLSKIDSDPFLLEAFYLGILGNISDTTKIELEKRCLDNVTVKQWLKLNNNLILAMDIFSFPSDIKSTCHDIASFLNHVDIYVPKRFHPSVHIRKAIVADMKYLTNFSDVHAFNCQFKLIKKYLADSLSTSIISSSLTKDDIINLNSQAKLIKQSHKFSNNHNIIYNEKYTGSKIISLDIIQANVTIFFLFFGLKLYRDNPITNMNDVGLKLETIYTDLEDFKANFNWTSYVNLAMSNYPVDKIIIDNHNYQHLCKLFGISKRSREITMGYFFEAEPYGYSWNKLHIFESACGIVLHSLIDAMKALLTTCNANIISCSIDEILISGMDKENLMTFLASNPISKYSFIARNYLRLEEFVVERHVLSNGKIFYVKAFTDGSIPCIKHVEPKYKQEAYNIVTNAMNMDDL